jgi:diol dehydratase reactivase alpha subunit
LKIIAGVDIGNSTTEVALGAFVQGKTYFLSTALTRTTGIKGTVENVVGIKIALEKAVAKAGRPLQDISLVRLNEAAPVIGDLAMETVTETIITESTMIGHNPSTPGGLGLGVGVLKSINEIDSLTPGESYILTVPKSIDFDTAAQKIQSAFSRNVDISGLVVQNNDAVLIGNRISKNIPIVDEVRDIHLLPLGVKAAVEVAQPGRVIQVLSDPYGIAGVFNLSPQETKLVIPIARALIGNRSAVILRTPKGDVAERKIPAGKIELRGRKNIISTDINEGAEKIMAALGEVEPLLDVIGEPGTNVGGMTERIRQVMAGLTGQKPEEIHIKDLLAVDVSIPQKVRGGIAGEFFMESGVALGAMVQTSRVPMDAVARKLAEETGLEVEIAGVEANMAILGALTTPGTDKPLAIIDLGSGSTDAAVITANNEITAVHSAGAGDMVNMLINCELGLNDMGLAEEIKIHPLAKVENLFQLRLQDGSTQFFEEALDPKVFGKIVLLKNGGMVPLDINHSLEKVCHVRREAKRKVFLENTVRSLQKVSPTGNIRHIEYVVMVGGSALDLEVTGIIADGLNEYGIVVGKGNIRGQEGPRNAVATGLVLSYTG